MDAITDNINYWKDTNISEQALLYELRDLVQTATFLKYKYTQIATNEEKEMAVERWKSIQHRIYYIKLYHRLKWFENNNEKNGNETNNNEKTGNETNDKNICHKKLNN